MMYPYPYPHQSESDYRTPLFTLNSTSLFPSSDGEAEIVYGFYWVSAWYWIEVLLGVCLTMLFAALTAVILYYSIVLPKKQNTTAAFLIGYGVLLPAWMYFPWFIVPLLNIQNLLFKFVLGGIIPTLVEFRLSEAICGFSPIQATQSLREFTLYFTSILQFEEKEHVQEGGVNSKKKKNGVVFFRIPVSFSMKCQHLLQFVALVFTLGLYQSWLSPYKDFIVFHDGHEMEMGWWFQGRRFFTWQLYANSFLHAFLFQLYLTTYCQGLVFFWSVTTGYQTKPVMNNPLLGGATSPSEFWGRRWNLLVHSVLKGGVYKPVRKILGGSPIIAGISTFLASGLFHEWLIYGIFETTCDTDSARNRYPIHYGGALVFFGWQALLISGEYLLTRKKATTGNESNKQRHSVFARLPRPIQSMCIIAMGIPMAHFFCEPYIQSNFFRHGQMGLPMILRVPA